MDCDMAIAQRGHFPIDNSLSKPSNGLCTIGEKVQHEII